MTAGDGQSIEGGSLQRRYAARRGGASSFVAILRACAKLKDLSRGVRVHDDILRNGLLDKCSDALVIMYAKCGALGKAEELLDVYKSRGAFTWTALISAYVQNGQGQNALNSYEQMQRDGLSPDSVAFACVLKACGSLGAADKGEEIHHEIVRQDLLAGDIVLGNALVDMYAKCGVLKRAQQVLEELPVRNVVSWSALIAGYAQHEQGRKALECLHQMRCEGLSPNAVTFVSLLKACAIIEATSNGKEFHDEIIRQGHLGDCTGAADNGNDFCDEIIRQKHLGHNNILSAALVDMYAKCGALREAKLVLERLSFRDVITWNGLIAGYAQRNQGEEALNCFNKMQREGLSPNAVTFSCILKACGSVGAIDKGEQIYDNVVRQGLLSDDVALGNALVDMYAKCGALTKAQQVLEELPVRDVVSWSALIVSYAQQGQGDEALNCYEQMQYEGLSANAVTLSCVLKACGNTGALDKGVEIHDKIVREGLLVGNTCVLGTALVDMYAKCGALAKAHEMLEGLPIRDVLSWNALIGGYADECKSKNALHCFEQMQCEGISPDAVTFTSVLSACGSIHATKKGEAIHDEVVQKGLLRNNVVLGNALIDMYAKCGELEKARRVFEELPGRDIVSWSTLVAGYAAQGQGEEALEYFEQMQGEGLTPDALTFACALKACGSIGAIDKGEEIRLEIVKEGMLGGDEVLGNALVDMYVKCGALSKAQEVFQDLSVQNDLSWAALITGYSQHGQAEQVLECYQRMLCEGVFASSVTFPCILKACGSIGALDVGEKIHDAISRQGLMAENVLLGNALVDMYAKCGVLAKAKKVLEGLPFRDIVSWSSLIAGYAQQGQTQEALSCFERMKCEGLSPDAAIFSCVLNACCLSGRVDDAQVYLGVMSKEYGIEPSVEHYTCVVDLLGRAGHLNKAIEVVENVPTCSAVWSALLAACCRWGDAMVGRWAFECAMNADRHDGGV